jgi:hypothetical protein
MSYVHLYISNNIHHIENKSAPFTYRGIGNGEYMPKKENLIFATLLMLGILDWLTTIMGVAFFGASEQNMILESFMQSNLFVFSIVKLSVVITVSLCLFKAVNLCKSNYNWVCTKGVLNISYLLTAVSLMAVVSNNLLVIIS